MSLELWTAFGVPAAIVLVIPGPTILTVISPHSAIRRRQSRRCLVFVAFLPQFIDLTANTTQQLWILASTFVCMAAINSTLYAVFAVSARGLLASAGAQRRFNIAGGSLPTAAGVWGLLAKRSV